MPSNNLIGGQVPVTGPFGFPLRNNEGSENEIRVAKKAGRYTLAIKADNAWRYFDENLKVATASTLGTMKVGSGLAITGDGTLSATGGGGSSGTTSGTAGAGGTGTGGTSQGTGGTGGGGDGGILNSTAATAGATNKGAGGGAASGGPSSTQAGANGGSGVVILRMPDASYSGTTTGSPTIDTSTIADETILIFNGDGTYTT